MPAYLGAISIWFTENPPLAKPAKARTLVMAVTLPGTPCAPGRNITAIALPKNPTKVTRGGYPQLCFIKQVLPVLVVARTRLGQSCSQVGLQDVLKLVEV